MAAINMTQVLTEMGIKKAPVMGSPAVARGAAEGGSEALKRMLASVAGGEAPQAGAKGAGAKALGGAKGAAGKLGGMTGIMAFLALQMLLNQGIEGGANIAGRKMQGEAIERQTQKLSPEGQIAGMSIPGAAQENQAALAAFMNAIGGSQAGSINLASGETQI